MSMTRKDYRILARSLYATKPMESTSEFYLWVSVVDSISMAMSKNYLNFNLSMFYKAAYKGE